MTSRSTRLTSFKSSVTLVPPAFICAFNSSICSRRMRPISLSVVVCPSESFSILKVTFVFSQVPRLNGCTLSATWNSLESKGFSFQLGPLFRRLLKTQPGASALIAFGFGIAQGEAVERNHRDITLNRPSFYRKRTYGNRVPFHFREALA
jgi:hypothetical protein